MSMKFDGICWFLFIILVGCCTLQDTKRCNFLCRTDVEALMEQVSLLRCREARLQQELHILQESNYSNEKMSVTLKQLEVII